MNVSFEKLNDVEGKIIVNVEESDYKAKVEAEIKKSAVHTAFPDSVRVTCPWASSCACSASR